MSSGSFSAISLGYTDIPVTSATAERVQERLRAVCSVHQQTPRALTLSSSMINDYNLYKSWQCSLRPTAVPL